MLRHFRVPIVLATLAAASVSPATAQRFEAVETFVWKPLGSDNHVPRWHNGFRAYFPNGAPLFIRVFDREGQLLMDADLASPAAPWDWITNVAVSPTRRVAFSFIRRGDGANGIGWLSADGRVERILRTDAYAPSHVSFAPDGTLWAQGPAGGLDLLAHYDATGTLIDKWEIPGEDGGNFGWLLLSSLFPIEDRVGIIMDRKRLWVEIAPDGTPIGQWPTPGGHDVTGAAMTADGDVYVAVSVADPAGEDAPGQRSIFRLDRSDGEWTRIDYEHLKEPGDHDRIDLYGAYRDGVIVLTNDREFTAVRPTE